MFLLCENYHVIQAKCEKLQFCIRKNCIVRIKFGIHKCLLSCLKCHVKHVGKRD